MSVSNGRFQRKLTNGRNLDDGVGVGFNQTHKTVDVVGKVLPPDVFTARSWGLLHQAGILTTPHHDAEGGGTFVVPFSGCKIWICIRIKDPEIDRKTFAEYISRVADRDEVLSTFKERIQCQVIYAYPGDLM